mmetsp:Transcript_28753/g.70105  ORF Transcript_28753/g.70105 Transcript_28753/m.70105 type:complete len:376 (-) Transcript_28753:76-1203(-)|eukprot:CAMPEP_0114494084 /NCGR_PEP_ID=MMETSP0109-20121206/4459_1 /TAXON_ID=29199 /ORGANISM="Chlorarachnion reptans, Strain CCCM449" /LENGTH=375 /DNA_ID=CAMNT_0001671089 /DNA_START=141 /DNA_END=1268 /DNA_ORIENTATION=+
MNRMSFKIAPPARRAFSTSSFKSNITPGITEKIGRNLHRRESHPLHIVKTLIEDSFSRRYRLAENGRPAFRYFDDLDPFVSTTQCFDELLVPPDHVSRSPSDTFYLQPDKVLRTHTSAHQQELMRAGHTAFLATGDCYRRDEIDSSHYPVFHQMEGVRVFEESNLDDEEVMRDLRGALEGLVEDLFGSCEMRWVDAYFPFTDPSLELEVLFQGEWLEVLGCGQIQAQILTEAGKEGKRGWAFGIGLERLAMALFQIPDIRLFWSEDARFLEQFEPGKITVFQEFSKYPVCYKDISFWEPEGFHANDFCAAVRDIAGDLVEKVTLIDRFDHPRKGKTSSCFRIDYRSMERSLTNKEVDTLQERLRQNLLSEGFQLR